LCWTYHSAWPSDRLALAVKENASRHSSLSKDRRYVVSTAFDPAVTSYADVDRLLRTEAQVQLTPFVLNNHPNSFKSHACSCPATRDPDVPLAYSNMSTTFFLVRVAPLQATGLAEAEEPVKGLRCAAMNATDRRP
jgi:hypothetical protein